MNEGDILFGLVMITVRETENHLGYGEGMK